MKKENLLKIKEDLEKMYNGEKTLSLSCAELSEALRVFADCLIMDKRAETIMTAVANYYKQFKFISVCSCGIGWSIAYNGNK